MKLTKKQIGQIKQDIVSGMKQAEIGAKYGVGRGVISDITTGRRHADVPWPDGEKATKRAKAPPQYDPENEKILELQAEVSHLLAERDHARRAAKAGAKEHGLFRAIVAELDNRISPFVPLPKASTFRLPKGAISESAVMHISDGHHDQTISLEESSGLEQYNFPISCRRAENYVDTFLRWTQKILKPTFHFPELFVFAYGDHTSGEIHGSVSRSYFLNQFKNCLGIGQLHAMMYRDLAAYFKSVNVIYLPGNHGRRSQKKDYHGAHDNWDYLIAKIAELHCRDMRNVSFLVPNAFSCNVAVNGVGFNLSHGDDVNSNGGIPFYGMVRRQKNLMALSAIQGGPRIRYFCMGHHHVEASLADLDGELIVNGAWPGTDSYCFNRFAGYREPSQLIHGVNPKHGITWRMNVHLRSKDDVNGPTRYKVSI